MVSNTLDTQQEPTMSGQGTPEESFQLEYASDDEYHTPPITSPITTQVRVVSINFDYSLILY